MCSDVLLLYYIGWNLYLKIHLLGCFFLQVEKKRIWNIVKFYAKGFYVGVCRMDSFLFLVGSHSLGFHLSMDNHWFQSSVLWQQISGKQLSTFIDVRKNLFLAIHSWVKVFFSFSTNFTSTCSISLQYLLCFSRLSVIHVSAKEMYRRKFIWKLL